MFIVGLILAIVTPFILHQPLKEWYLLTNKHKPAAATWVCFAASFFILAASFIPFGIILSIIAFSLALGAKGAVRDEKQKRAQEGSSIIPDPASIKNTEIKAVSDKVIPKHQLSLTSTKKQKQTTAPKEKTTVSNMTAPDRRFSKNPVNRSAKNKPATGSIVSFDYTNRKGEFSHRIIRVSRCGLTYLEGFDLDKNQSREFRLDRIDGVITDINTGEVFYP